MSSGSAVGQKKPRPLLSRESHLKKQQYPSYASGGYGYGYDGGYPAYPYAGGYSYSGISGHRGDSYAFPRYGGEKYANAGRTQSANYSSSWDYSYQKGGKPKPPRIKLDESTSVKITLNKDKVVCFFGREHFLANFYPSPVCINGHTYPTVEHYYEACKVYALVGAEWARNLKAITDPAAAKAASKRMLAHLSKADIDYWRQNDGILVMKVGIVEKFKQNRDLAVKLLQTGDSFLAQCNKFDQLWSVGLNEEEFKKWLETNSNKTYTVPADIKPEALGNFPRVGSGRNLQGFALMMVRQQLNDDIKLARELGYGELKVPEPADDGTSCSSSAVSNASTAIGDAKDKVDSAGEDKHEDVLKDALKGSGVAAAAKPVAAAKDVKKKKGKLG